MIHDPRLLLNSDAFDFWHDDEMNRSIITNNSSSRVCRSSVDDSPPFHCCLAGSFLDILWVILLILLMFLCFIVEFHILAARVL